jgi:hypothetical protein
MDHANIALNTNPLHDPPHLPIAHAQHAPARAHTHSFINDHLRYV